MLRLFFVSLLTIIICATAQAITLDGLITKGTFECIGVRVQYTGDDNQEATVAVRYREKGTATWLNGHPMIRIVNNRFATSLFWLKENTTYEIELLPEHANGVTINFPQPFEVKTRSSEFPAPGNIWYVDASAANNGTGTAAQPFNEIQEAADVAQPGDTVKVRPGIYREEVRPAQSGNENAWIIYEGIGDGAILDGSEIIDTQAGWQNEGAGVYSKSYSGNPRYACLDDVRLYKHSSVNNLQNDGDGITGGFFISGGKIYVKAPDAGPLTNRVLRVGKITYGFYLNGKHHIAIRNFEVCYFDGENIRLRDSHHCAVQKCKVHHARQMIAIDRILATDNLVEECQIWGTGVPDWPWEICHHDHDCSSNGVRVSNAGEGNVVRRNHVSGVYNGIYVGQWTTNYPEENALENDVYENVIEVVKDDAIEPECQAINLRIFKNECKNLFVAISLAPIETGPTWVLYNTIHSFRPHDKGKGQWMKIAVTPNGTKPMGQVRIYHNSSYSNIAEHNGWNSVGSGNTHFKNNIVRCTRYVFENTVGGPYPPGNEWDYNLFYTTDTGRYIKYENVRMNEAEFKALGFQQMGINAEPEFESPQNGDLRLKPQSPAIDKGILLPGINESFKGNGPDMGAFESAGLDSSSPQLNLERIKLAGVVQGNPTNILSLKVGMQEANLLGEGRWEIEILLASNNLVLPVQIQSETGTTSVEALRINW